MHELRFDFVLHHSGLDELQNALKTSFCDITCALHLVHFLLRLDRAQAVQDGRRALVFVIGVFGAQGGVFAVGSGLDGIACTGVRIVVQVQRIGFCHEAVEGAFEGRRPLDVGDARCSSGFGLVQFGPFPNGQFLVCFQCEQDLAVVRIVSIWEQNQHGLLLIHARQPQDVAGLFEWKRPIRTCRIDIVGKEHRNGARLHLRHEIGAVARVQVGGKRLVSHEAKIPKPCPTQYLRHMTNNAHQAPKPVGAYPFARKAGNLLFLSGVGPRVAGSDGNDSGVPGLSLDHNGNFVEFDFEAQVHSVFANVKAILDANGSSWEELLDITVFLVHMNRDFKTFNRIYAEYFPDPATQPCRTTIEINRLPTPIAIELKCVASIAS